MSLKSLLGGKGAKGDETNPSRTKPKFPSNREILEDIESIKKQDPILSLAAILQKELIESGRHSIVVDSDIKGLMEAMQKRKRRESQSTPSTSSHHFSSRKNTEEDEDDEENIEDSEDAGDSTLDYDKLKHFLKTCEHSQELVTIIETEFKKLHQDVLEQETKAGPQSVNQEETEESNLL